ncbi:zinc ABC transporter substrate-binding protein [Defluviimonas sp. WL0002]|uniref:High-affinity zinc uptake system protein ZnuA n=1 Tax=Albidovulum marisflavi TaxID=2984159 RepID=A0ABT2ZEA2_9RHOB|nr:zinc ABC transporter substrate-binding protein [Defluviimonas sp. WL0002]MCV2869425.1 zinc ABC transporter substrate-binding protein [Defluviimonas sp. WL0002]
MRILPILALLAAQPAAAEVPRVVTDMPVVHSLVAAVMGDLGAPEVLLDRGADAHDFQLRPSQRAALGEANVVFWIGPEMTPWLDRALNAVTPDQTVALLDVSATSLRHFDGDPEPDGHDDEGEHHHEGGIDPHAWLNPDNAAVWLDAIAETLIRQDGEHSGVYLANAAMAKAGLRDLTATIEAEMASTPKAPIIVAHDALGYFADRFGLTIAASVAKGDAAAPGAGHLSETRMLLESGAVACIFPEAGTDPKSIETLDQDTPARIGRALDPEGRALEPGPGLYTELLTAMSAAIRDCLAEAS